MTEIVKVAIHGDRGKYRNETSKLKCFEVHPTNNPIQIIAPYNPSREKVWISAVDVTVVITNDLPPQDQIPSQTVTNGQPPQGSAILLASQGNGNSGFEIYGPDTIYAVAILGNTACRLNVSQILFDDA